MTISYAWVLLLTTLKELRTDLKILSGMMNSEIILKHLLFKGATSSKTLNLKRENIECTYLLDLAFQICKTTER